MAASLNLTIFPSIGEHSRSYFRAGQAIANAMGVGNQYAVIYSLPRAALTGCLVPIYSDSVPVNSFPRNTSSSGVHATDDQFVFDTQSAGWEVCLMQIFILPL